MADSAVSTRAGSYVSQATGYRAYMPAAASTATPRSTDRRTIEPTKEAMFSSQIEGTQFSLQDLLAAEAQLFDQNLPYDVDEVINYVRAMNHGLA